MVSVFFQNNIEFCRKKLICLKHKGFIYNHFAIILDCKVKKVTNPLFPLGVMQTK